LGNAPVSVGMVISIAADGPSRGYQSLRRLSAWMLCLITVGSDSRFRAPEGFPSRMGSDVALVTGSRSVFLACQNVFFARSGDMRFTDLAIGPGVVSQHSLTKGSNVITGGTFRSQLTNKVSTSLFRLNSQEVVRH
jgi:hypothetical protein